MVVQARGITQKSVAQMHMTSDEPVLWLDPVKTDGDYSSTVRQTGEDAGTWWGMFMTYNSVEEMAVIGTHNDGANTTAGDVVAMIIDRSNGFVKFGDNVDATDPPLARVHIEEDGMIMEELAADPADPGAGRFVMWLSDGTASGDDGDVVIKINNGVTTKTITLVDFSAF